MSPPRITPRFLRRRPPIAPPPVGGFGIYQTTILAHQGKETATTANDVMEVIRDAAKILQRARQDSNLRLRRYQKFEKGRRKTLESPDFFRMSLGIATLQTLAFVTLVCGNQSTTHAVRARRRIWALPHPCRWLIISSVADVLIAATLATLGWLMMPLPLWIVSGVIVGAIAFAFFLDLVKLLVFSRLKIV